jgi:hypothetical protein
MASVLPFQLVEKQQASSTVTKLTELLGFNNNNNDDDDNNPGRGADHPPPS